MGHVWAICGRVQKFAHAQSARVLSIVLYPPLQCIIWVSLFGGMEWWNGTVEWNSGMEWWNDHAHRSRSMTTYTQYSSVFSS